MAKEKEKALNPAAAQRKADKQRALKKSKAAVTAQRNERLAHRNPDRLQRQIDELKDLEQRRGQLSQREKSTLADLERDVVRIRKARDAVGEKVPDHSADARTAQRAGGSVLGKRDRNSRQHGSERVTAGGRARARSWSSSATDDDVHAIPMPRDTPPPIPARRRNDRRAGERRAADDGAAPGIDSRPAAPVPASHLVYESKPVLRDLQKEATGFVPNVVKRKMDAVRGGVNSRLMEEEELDRLEREGYVPDAQHRHRSGENAKDAVEIVDDQLEEEMNRFRQEMRHVQIEEVEDEEA